MDVKAIGITTTVVVITGATFLMIYWLAIIIFPTIMLGIIGLIAYTISSTTTKEEPPEFDFRG